MLVLSPSKRKRALDLLRHGNVSRLDAEAQLVYAVGLIICDDEGHINEHRLHVALNDRATCVEAAGLLKRAGVSAREV